MVTKRLLPLLWLAFGAHCAGGTLLDVPTRDGVTTAVFWEPADHPTATVLLFPGGGGGWGQVVDGRATGNNFLVRSVPDFTARGLNVAVIGRPSDSVDLNFADRISAWHLTDVRKVLEVVREKSPQPVWLVGTSRGTISAAATAIHSPDGIAGLVLTSSVLSYKKPGALPTQDLAAIRMPVLVLHHSKDACVLCPPQDVPALLRGLKNAPVKKAILVSGGGNPTGDPCAALHWHGFIGMEREAVDAIADWIQAPGN